MVAFPFPFVKLFGGFALRVEVDADGSAVIGDVAALESREAGSSTICSEMSGTIVTDTRKRELLAQRQIHTTHLCSLQRSKRSGGQ